MSRFPDGFLWGAATAGHQVEGGNVNADLWPLEWMENSNFNEPSGDACDHYHRYAEDMSLLAQLGCNAYRFSLEWSRIEPEPGYFSLAALDHYRRMIGTCRELGLTPIVTYNHFSAPRWFAGEGGWGSEAAPTRFARYASRATGHLGDLLAWVCTLNEPNVMSMLQHTGVLPMGVGDRGPVPQGARAADPGIGGFDPSRYRMGLVTGDVERMADAHRRAVEAIKSGPGDTKVGWTLALVDLQAVEGGEQRCDEARRRGQIDWLSVSRDDDFVGVQTYSRNRIGPEGRVPPPEGEPAMQTGWEVYPEALGHTVRLAAAHARVPVLVTENGMATDDDDARIAYTRAALHGLAGTIGDGVDVRGYVHWTLLDNFEWTSGYSKTFGLIAVDRRTFRRTVKPSGHWLGRVARANRLE
ncbi:MAG: glycoside hydrolase family 1 protein [Acidimicrobiales bacterium]